MLLNIGCGAVAHPDWLNLDMVPLHPLAVACDLRRVWRVARCDIRVPRFPSFMLNAPAADSPPRKPDSLYVEAIKAAA